MIEYLRRQKRYIFFILVSFFFLIVGNSLLELDYLSTYGILFGLAAAVLFLAYAFVFLIEKDKSTHGRVLDALFLLSLLNLIGMFTLTGSLSKIILDYNISTLYVVAISAVFCIAIAMPLFFAAHAIRDKKISRNRKVLLFCCIMLAMVLFVIALYFLSGLFVKYYVIDDEFFISIKDIAFALRGLNPYQQSVSQQLYYNRTSVGWTLTTKNQIIGILNYPALYLVSYLPVYFIAKPTIYNMEHYMAPLQAAILFAILIFTIAFSIDRKYLQYPAIGLLLFVAFMFLNTASITTYLMLALLILAYSKLDKWYSFALLGLCLAAQEMLWIPVVLLLVYSLNNKGVRAAIKDAAGSILVFLAVNSYFIALGPSTFFGALFNPLDKLLMPIGSSSLFGFFILANYHVLLSSYTAVFAILVVLMALAYAYFNRKVLVGLFSMVPLLFLSRSLIAYYIFFVSFIFVTMLIEEKRKPKGLIEEPMRKRKLMAGSVAILLVLSIVGILYYSHVAYAKQFDISVSNQSLGYDSATSQSIYKATISYKNMPDSNAYIMFFGYGGGESQIIGIYNDSIINSSVVCASGNIQCLLNVNRIALNGTGSYTISAHLGSTSEANSIEEGRLIIYNGTYFYIADSVATK